MFLALTQLQELVLELASVPVLFVVLVAVGRRLKRKHGVRLGVIYLLFSIVFSIYLPLLVFTILGGMAGMGGRFQIPGPIKEGLQFLGAAVTLLGAIVFIALLRRFFWEIWFEKRAQTQAPKFLSQLVGLLIFITAVLFVLTVGYGKDISVLLGASGLAAIVLGLALQDLLGNVIAGIALELGKPFKPGDWLVVDGKHAEVIEVNWRSTRLRDNDDIYRDIPNKAIVGATITNLTHPNRQHGIRLRVNFDYSAPPNFVKDTLKRAAANAAYVLSTPQPKVFLKNFGPYSIEYEIRFWMDDQSKYNDILDAIRTNIWYEAQRSGLKIPFPIRTIQIERPKPEVREKLDVARASMRRQSFLQLLAPAQLDAMLNGARLLRFGRTERIIEQGAEGRSMFIVAHGEAEVLVKINDIEKSVAVLREGDYCGEMSLLTGEPRSASVLAKTDCEMWEIGKDVLAGILAENQPLVEKLSDILTTRKLEMEGIVAHAMATDDVKAKQKEYKASFLKRLYGFFEL
jgi:small-conductance mechanosensitive channel